ncbi:MAG: SpoIID/LytB domain-containing protein [Nitrospiraceae bacterium]|jgi:stage II sporulation protein D|nr:MAG: SpoIID/LytB domain-containing protein [Nitrospiraceae bacterium]
MTLKKIFIVIGIFLFSLATADARTIKVLILDDVFQKIPEKDERIEKMGNLKGDLLVNGTHYLGNIEVWKGTESLYLVNELPFEEYIKNVVSAEVGTNWDMEALKVQAVISRTYAMYQKKKNGTNANFDLTSSVLHQVYKGTSPDTRIAYAVENTEGEVLTYDGNLIEAFYHSTSGGKTEDPSEVFGKSYPYLKPVESNCEISPYWIWERRIPVEEIEKALNVKGILNVQIKSYTSTQRVKTVDVFHSEGILNVNAKDLRKMLGWSRLPSTNFTLSRDNGNYVFDGKGYGHGVGLCQWSALEMSREGMTYKQILDYFYPGTTLQKYEDR